MYKYNKELRTNRRVANNVISEDRLIELKLYISSINKKIAKTKENSQVQILVKS